MPNRKPSQMQGAGSIFKRIITIIIGLGFVVAFWQIPADPSVKTVWDGVQNRADKLYVWAKSVGEWDFDFIFKTPDPLTVNPDFTFDLENLNPNSPTYDFETVKLAADELPTNFNSEAPYNRGDWYHWENFERSCWTVREEVLYRDAVKDASLTLLDANKIRTTNKEEACYISGGTWIDPFTGEEFRNPEDLDIDHVIALSYANSGGGSNWDVEKKRQYANSLEYSKHLLAVSASANRSKSDKGPSEWMPDNEGYHCTYAEAWTTIAAQWGLNVKSADRRKLKEILSDCENPLNSLLDNN